MTIQGGSAAAPSLTFSGDTNTGIFSPAADTIAFTEGGVESMRIDSAGNVRIGTTSDLSAADRLTVVGGNIAVQRTSGITTFLGDSTQNGYTGTITNHAFAILTNSTERARFTSGGYFKASNSGTYQSSTSSSHELRSDAGDWTATITNTSTNTANNYGVRIIYPLSTPNNTTQSFLSCGDATIGTRAEFRSNGGLANYSGNNVNLSDRREKTNFAPAGDYLSKICAIPVQTFNYIDQSEDDPGLTLGVVAQDVQAVAPELVMESNWGAAEEPKMRLSIYQTDLQYALMKCIQELKAELDATKAEVALLKGAA
jgi:hypothetical protein